MTESAPVWRKFLDTPYDVSSDGDVRRGPRILRPWTCRGYLRVTLLWPRRHHFYVHRMVAIAHLEAPIRITRFDELRLLDGIQVDHISANRMDPSVDNLQWVDHVQNYDLRDERRAEDGGIDDEGNLYIPEDELSW